MHHPDDRDERFMAWLLKNAPHLDIPSRSAQTLYRNLLAFVCRFSDDTYMGEDSSDLSQLMKLIDDEPSEQARELIPDDRMLLDKSFRTRCSGRSLNAATAISARSPFPPIRIWSFPLRTQRRISKNTYTISFSAETRLKKSDMLYLLWIASGFAGALKRRMKT